MQMILISAASDDAEWITNKLEKGKERPKSGDFLDGFPWKSVNWYKASLEYNEFEDLFLFWNGLAWGESSHQSRRLKDGARDFIRIANDPHYVDNVHLNEITNLSRKFRDGSFHNTERFLILGGLSQSSRLIILDGNHRAAASLWWAIESGDHSRVPLSAWVGLSSDMILYSHYRRVLQSE